MIALALWIAICAGIAYLGWTSAKCRARAFAHLDRTSAKRRERMRRTAP